MRFVGIDLHKVNCQGSAFDDETGELIERKIPTSAESLREFFQGWPPCRVVVESATESEWVARVIEKLGHEMIVADPNFAPMYATRNKKIKTDKRDARALMDACRLGAYRRAHRVSDAQKAVRRKLTVRDTLVRSRTKSINAVRSLTRQEGCRVPSGGAETFHLRVRGMVLAEELRDAVAPLLDLIEQLTAKIATSDEEVAEIGKSKTTQLLQTVPNVGAVTSVAFVATLDGCGRFQNARDVAAYLGLVPSEHSSGERQHRGSITKRGNPRMRWLLIQAAHGILRKRTPANEPLHVWANALAVRKGKQIAAVALARRLARILYAVWRDGKPYSPRELERPSQHANQAA